MHSSVPQQHHTGNATNGAPLARTNPMSLAKHQLWAEVKRAYFAGDGSLCELAKRFGVSRDTLEKRCAREHWRQHMAALDGIVAAEAAKAAAESGREMGLTAAAFERRTIDETWDFLDRIIALARSGTLDADTLLKLVTAWKTTVGVGREVYRLDEPAAPAPTLSFSRLDVHLHEPGGAPVIDCPPASLPESCAEDGSAASGLLREPRRGDDRD